MQKPILSSTTTRRIYSTRGIIIGSILAGPIVAGYMLSSNSTALELKDKNRIWMISIGAFILVCIMAYSLPKSVPAVLFIFANAALGYYMTQYLQGKHIENHINNGGRMYSGWRSAGIALVFTTILVFVGLACFFIADLSAGRI